MASNESKGAHLVGRRGWLLGAAASGAFAAAGVAAFVRTRGYADVEREARGLAILSVAQYALVRDVARRLLAADAAGAPSPDTLGVARFVDGYVNRLRPRLQTDFLRMVRFTEHVAPLWCGHLRRFTALDPFAQDHVLAALEASGIDELRGGFQALKSVVMMGYYRDPRTFGILQYGGPLIAEPQEAAP